MIIKWVGTVALIRDNNDIMNYNHGYIMPYKRVTNLPLTGAPSIISYFAIVSFSLKIFGEFPTVSRLIIAISINLIFIRTNKKYIFPTITSFKWYLQQYCQDN